MLLNLNSKFKFFLTTTFLFSSPDTLALHLSVSIDDKESPISESLIIKDVISIGAVPFKVIRTELPPEFNGAVNGIPEVAAESPEFTGGVNDMDPPIHEIPEYKGCITNCGDEGPSVSYPDYKPYPHHDYNYKSNKVERDKLSFHLIIYRTRCSRSLPVFCLERSGPRVICFDLNATCSSPSIRFETKVGDMVNTVSYNLQ